MQLYNTQNKEELVKGLQNEQFTRKTVSFYRYVKIIDPSLFRDKLFEEWNKLDCKGRIYIAEEGINAQMSIPEPNLEDFLSRLNATEELKEMPLKWAIEDQSLSFLKLIVKVKRKIVADGLVDGNFDVCNVGNHLSPLEFHEELSKKENLVIDMRNHYESEIGHFENAFCPDSDTFREEIQLVVEKFKEEKERKVLLYCTGGIRCEKASAYLRHHGFQNVNQLHGGIIAYAQEIKTLGLDSKFIGKNFVFDERLGERISSEIIANCHQCGKSCDTHTNCANTDCHLLFIQCDECKEEYEGCCTSECQSILQLPMEERVKMRSIFHKKYSKSQIYRKKIRPSLKIK